MLTGNKILDLLTIVGKPLQCKPHITMCVQVCNTLEFYNYHAIVKKQVRIKNLHFLTPYLIDIHLVSNRKILTILRAATNFLTETFINVAAFLIRTITTIFFIITHITLRNTLAIFAHEKRAVT